MPNQRSQDQRRVVTQAEPLSAHAPLQTCVPSNHSSQLEKQQNQARGATNYTGNNQEH